MLLLLLSNGSVMLLLRLNLIEMGRKTVLAIRVVRLTLRLLRLVARQRRLRLLRVGGQR